MKFKSLFPSALVLAVIIGAALLTTATVRAVQVRQWTFNTEGSYAKGHFVHTAVNNYGELALCPGLKALVPHPISGLVNAVTMAANGTLYFGTSPAGKVYALSKGKLSVLFSPPAGERQILALQLAGAHHLLIAACGTRSQLLDMPLTGAHPVPKVIFSHPGVQYIWDIQPASDGSIFLATGPHGQIWRVGPHGHAHLLATFPVHNVMALALSHSQRHLIAGTDGAGLVVKVNTATGKSFVLLSSGNAEISALAIGRQGTIYAATASPGRAKSSGGLFVPQAKPDGRPAAVSSMPIAGGKPGKHAAMVHMGHLPMPAAPSGMPPTPYPGVAANQKSNCVYAIGAGGRVTTILDVPDMILSMVYHDGSLILGTGPNGRIISYNPRTQTQILLNRFKQHDILSMAAAPDGTLYLGTANLGQVYRLGPNRDTHGTYTSQVLNAMLPAVWGVPHVQALVPAGTQVTIQTRSGNVKNVGEFARFWSPWSAAIPANSYQPISSPRAKFLQFRLTLNAKTGLKSPVVRGVHIGYQQINVAPDISSITVSPLRNGKHRITIQWHATDPNGDTLSYSLYYQQQAMPVWIKIAKAISDKTYAFNTSGLPNGNYRVKVVASDAPSNPLSSALEMARESNWFTVVNTAPKITNLKAVQMAGRRVKITGVAHGRLVAITAVAIKVDSGSHWQPAASSTSIFDSPLQAFSAETRVLSIGAHRIVVRVTDAEGNQTFQSVLVNVHG